MRSWIKSVCFCLKPWQTRTLTQASWLIACFSFVNLKKKEGGDGSVLKVKRFTESDT